MGRPVAILEADDASNPEQAVKAATKFIKEDRIDVLMGTLNGDCALAVSALAKKENKLFMVTGSYLPELTGAACDSHTFVFMPNASMLAQAVTPQLVRAYRHPLVHAHNELIGRQNGRAGLWSRLVNSGS